MAKEKEEKKHKHAGHGIKSTHIEHHGDGSHTVKHMQEDGSEHPGSGAAADLDGVHDKLENALGTPNPGEGDPMAAAGGAGAPPAGAPAAGAPAGGM
jgi:hypothetical protein